VADDEHPFVFRLTRVKEIVLRQSLAGQNGGGIRNGVGCCDRRFGGDRIGVGAKAVHGGGRAKGEENGQFGKFHGLEVLIHFYFGHGLVAADTDISNNQVSSRGLDHSLNNKQVGAGCRRPRPRLDADEHGFFKPVGLASL
jgi:hypothetical protein